MTVAEYEQVPDPPEGVWELYHGELVKVGVAKFPHMKAQTQTRELLRIAAGALGVVCEVMPFRPLREYECWAADVAFVSKVRWETIGDWLMGVPELVVEIISPSNTRPKLLDKARVCLENGCREFWLVELRRRNVTSLTSRGEAVYESGQRQPLFFGGEVGVDQIFS